MIWQNPWALAGAVSLAVPVLIHLLSRTQATIQRFPSLRFLDVSRLLPTRSPRITDVPLLLVRMSIFSAAVVALAAPLFMSANRSRAFNASVARAIVVDTSTSVVSGTVGGADSLRAQASRLAADVQASALLRTDNAAEGVAEAVAWLATQSGRGEVVVLSDFQTSSVDSVTLARIPRQYGVKFVRVASNSAGRASGATLTNAIQSQSTVVEITSEPARTVAEWSLPVPSANDSLNGLVLLSADADKSSAEAARQAALQIVAPPANDTSMAVAIVYAGATDFAALAKSAQPLDKSWMGEFIRRLQNNEDFQTALSTSDVANDTTVAAPLFVVGRNTKGNTVVFAARALVNNHERVVLFARMNAGTMASAQLIAAATRASALAWNASERETRTISDAALTSLQREAGKVAPQRSSNDDYATTGASDARWFWALALALLVIEAYMRRDRRTATEAVT